MTGDYLKDRKIGNIKKFLNSYNLMYGTDFTYDRDSDYEKTQEKFDYIFRSEEVREEIILVQHTNQSEVRRNSTLIADENIFYNKIIPKFDDELKRRKLNLHINLYMKPLELRSVDVEPFIAELCDLLEKVSASEEFNELKLSYELSHYLNAVEYSKRDEPSVIGVGINTDLAEESHQDLLELLQSALERKSHKYEAGIILLIDFISYPFIDEDRLNSKKAEIEELTRKSQWQEIWLVNDFATESFKIK
jgi:hypothetical protein